MKKVSLALLIIIVFNFIFCSFAYADNTTNDTTDNETFHFNVSSMHQADQEGTVEVEGNTKEIDVTQSIVGAILGTIISPVVGLAEICSGLVSSIAVLSGYYHTDSEFGADKDQTLKISSIIFGEFLLFDANITKTTSSLNAAITPSRVATLIDTIKETSVGAFEIVRAVAIGIFLILILVTAIRLSVSNVAEDRAKFKALILDWVIGLLFTFFVKYFVLALSLFVDTIMEVLWTARISLETSNKSSFEFSVYKNIWQVLVESGGMQFFAYGLLYIVLFLVTMDFAIKYLIRLVKVLCLVIVSPLVGALYTFKRAGSNKSNAVGEWLKSYSLTLAIQPIHAITYLIFMFTANEIAINAPFLGIIFLWALGRIEKIIKAILGLNDNISVVGK